MLKVYEWLVYIIMRPHKKFQYLIKWFGIFIRAKTNYRKRKERLNRKELENPYLSPRRSRPSQPTRPTRGRGVFFLAPRTQAARWNATEPAGDDTSTPRSFQPSPWPLLAPGRAWRRREPIPPLQSFLLLLPCSFPSPPESAAVHRREKSLPTTSRSRTKVSKRFAVVVFIDLQKESEPDASTSSPASSSSSPAAVDRLRILATPAPPRASNHSS